MNGPIHNVLRGLAPDTSAKIPLAALPLVECDECGAVTTEDSQAKHAAWHAGEAE